MNLGVKIPSGRVLEGFWKASIGKVEDMQLSLDRVRRLLRPIMLRRTKHSMDKYGKPILTLPPIEMKTVAVQFSPAEREFYSALHPKSCNKNR
jgi:SNF2 family DNA or RNA helicase